MGTGGLDRLWTNLAETAEPVTAVVFLASGLFLALVEAGRVRDDPVAAAVARWLGWAYVGIAVLVGLLLALGVLPWAA
ncbi:MAG: hypothetical protein DIU69_06815 [Bacillota bacterium]|nr:MAG: hypothetical protein DIU69_06815 [Bacillota bacterium]